jgi:hypothetical protein
MSDGTVAIAVDDVGEFERRRSRAILPGSAFAKEPKYEKSRRKNHSLRAQFHGTCLRHELSHTVILSRQVQAAQWG